MKCKRLSENADEIEKIIIKNYDDIYRYCYWKTCNNADAQDITQETFYRFVQSITNYSDQGKPKAFLYTIARNLCINWQKQIKPYSLNNEELIEDIGSITEFEHIENKVSLQIYLDLLPKKQQEILLLRFGQGMNISEMSKITGMTRFVIMYQLKLALATLKKSLKKGGMQN